jgi:tetratricopeptide (TPR) repeat protein
MKGVDLDKELVRNEPGNLQWEGYLAGGYSAVAEISEHLGDAPAALTYYQKLVETRRILAYRLGPPKARKELATAAKMLGDRSLGFAQNENYRLATRVWQRIVEDPDGRMLAIDQFDVVFDFAQRFKDQSDWPNAKIAYETAKKIAELNLTKDPSSASWRKKFDDSGVEAVKAETALQGARP